MCGIAGIVAPERGATDIAESTLERMADALVHRGPDDSGIWYDAAAGIGLAHRRLAIIDLSPAGAQPMLSDDQRVALVFNGEIYNHMALRAELEQQGAKITWRGHSDTESLLAAIAQWGIKDALRRISGMFALALWDGNERCLWLARDRIGEKPLYLARTAHGWLFASEPQAFRAAHGFSTRLDADALAQYLAFSAVPDSRCVYAETRKVTPGGLWRIDARTGAMSEHQYDSFSALCARGRAQRSPAVKSAADAADQIERVLTEAVASQMVSDVPLGSFLSGGVDSSLITALMQVQSDRPIRTFSIGFAEGGYDESAHAERVAAHLGTEHMTFHVSEEDALNLIPRLSSIYGEPFADSSQVPTALLCQHARREVTVALTGDGGDEIFGGYTRYLQAPRLWNRLSRLPLALRQMAGPVGRGVQWLGGAESSALRAAARGLGLPATTLNKAARLGEVVQSSRTFEDVFASLIRTFDKPEMFLHEKVRAHIHASKDFLMENPDLTPEERMMTADSCHYLPSDILVKVDRAAMAASLETRAPFLDKRVVEAAWSLPLAARIENGQGKRVLREILDRYVPRALIERPKQGFAIPIDQWLRGELRDWASGLLSKDALGQGGVLSAEPVERLWADHLAKRGNHGQKLWTLLMLQSWLLDDEGVVQSIADANIA